MKKILTTLLILSSFVFAKEYRSYTYAHVTSSEPIYEYRYKRVYNEQCDDYYESSYHEPRYYNNTNNIGLDTLIGATIGVAIGNQIGKGNGRDVAKVAGGILGASYANHHRNDGHAHHKKYKKRHYKHCNDGYYTTSKRRVLVGYKNYFFYKNKEHFKITSRPKNRIKITKIVRY